MSDVPGKRTRASKAECSAITDHMGFNLGNAVECLWQADASGEAFALLQQARAYIDREMQLRERKA